MSEARIIALVGMPGSGKSTVASWYAEKGCPSIYFGQIVIEEVARLGLELSPSTEQQVREGLRRDHGMDVCAQRAIPKIDGLLPGGKPVILDGLYSMSEYEALLARYGRSLALVTVFTTRGLRYSRLASRGKRPLTPEQASTRDFAEVKNLEKGGPIALADYMLLNDGSIESLKEHADQLLATILGGDAVRPRSSPTTGSSS